MCGGKVSDSICERLIGSNLHQASDPSPVMLGLIAVAGLFIIIGCFYLFITKK
jgi:hypothetical protein